MVRASKQRINRAIATARRNFGVNITPEIARGIIGWDEEDSFVSELEDSGQLDTAPLDYFGMALLEQIMPGKPTVQDHFISRPLERWHFPLNGSSDDYKAAFLKAWRKAVRRLRPKR